MTQQTTTSRFTDSFMIRGDQFGTPAALMRLGDELARLAQELPPEMRDVDLASLRVRVEDGELVLVQFDTLPTQVPFVSRDARRRLAASSRVTPSERRGDAQ